MQLTRFKLHNAIGLFLVLIIGFGFGLFLLMQPKSAIESNSHDVHSATAETSMPGMDMSDEESMPGMDMSGNSIDADSPHTSTVPLLFVFTVMNVAVVISAIIFQRVKSKKKARSRQSLPILESKGHLA